MKVLLKPEYERLVEELIQTRQFETVEEVVQAGLEALRQDEMFGNFAVGELDTLILAGEQSANGQELLDANQALAVRRAKRASPSGS